MIVTSLFLFHLMCSYMPCDPKYKEPAIAETVGSQVQTPTPTKYRFSRSGLTKKRPTVEDNVISSDGDPFAPVIKTTSGVVEGYFMKTINARKIYAFEGITYAQAPIGVLRFRNPVPAEPWTGIRQAKDPGPICLQYHVRKLAPITGSEDCLRLNIYTPSLPLSIKGKLNNPGYPTIFWIHGGGFFFGGGSEFGPSYMLQEDVILVTVNYRLGLLGFLSTNDDESPGNYGLKDQALALKWVSENIAAFGGDPNKITLMGQSAGAAAAHLHMMSPLSKHLFQGAISMSGSALNHWAVSSPSRSLRLTRRLAENVGCPTTIGSRALMDCFRASNPNFLLHQQQRLHDFMTFPPILFAPVVERSSPESFLSDTPDHLYALNQVERLPWICTQTTEEGESFAKAFKYVGRIPFYQSNFERFAPQILDYWYIARNASEITARIRNVYFGNDGPNPNDENSIRILSDLVSDRYFRVGIHRAIVLHSRIAPTYASLFGFRGQVGPSPSFWGEDKTSGYGVGHASDNAFYFNSSVYFIPLQMGTPSYDVSRMLVNLASNFAKTREPLLRYTNGNEIKIWKPAANYGNDLRFLLINNENVIMIPEPRQYDLNFWESLGLDDTPTTSTWTNSQSDTTFQPTGYESLTIVTPPPLVNGIESSTGYYSTPYDQNQDNSMYTYSSFSNYK